jgi:hypothetical protein
MNTFYSISKTANLLTRGARDAIKILAVGFLRVRNDDTQATRQRD